MSRLILLFGLTALAGCQSLGTAPQHARGASGSDAGALASLTALLPGDYDNHEQVERSRAANKARTGIAPMHVQHSMRVVETGRDSVTWLWRLSVAGQTSSSSIWLFNAQVTADGHHVRLVPSRPTDTAAAQAQFADPAKAFHFEAAQWAALEPCAQSGQTDGTKFSAAANVDSCSALLPGLGQDAALLPLRMSIDSDMLQVATFADSSRGADAIEEAHRVRWYDGWAAINGGGPNAKSDNNDWHLQRDLHLASEGGRAALHWRDGAPSGYTLELEHTSYPERKLSVLQLNVIEDGSGRTVTYVWTDPGAGTIGLNLGWLQVGIGPAAAPGPERSK
jgi:hypothetical protein